MNFFKIDILLLSLLIVILLYRYYSSSKRNTEDVLSDLYSPLDKVSKNLNQVTLNSEAICMGYFDAKSLRNYRFKQRTVLIAVFVLILCISNLYGGRSSFILVLTGMSCAYIFTKVAERKKRSTYLASIDYYLPIVMERIVIGVQSGLDVYASLKIITEIGSTDEPDPVTELLSLLLKLTESGMSFNKAINELSNLIQSNALRHTLIHLELAQKDGGELVQPLRELSDSTQLYYQETVEEQIAKLPVKATMPLTVTFAGLIICFISAPLIYVTNLTSQMTVSGGF